jgi:steroid 5-alpha reductase family enzyme
MDAGFVVTAAMTLIAIMACAWVVQRATGRSGWVDTLWSLAVGAGGVLAAVWPDAEASPLRRFAVGVLIALWSLRLAGHIAARTKGGDDDPRYADLARQWGRRFPPYLFVFLQIQAAAALVLVLAVRLAAIRPGPFPALGDFLGGAVLLVAVVGEATADAQLARFAHANKGKKAVCDVGLWAWSRHPNYFFEWLGWCAWAVMAVDPGWPWGWLALAAPALMYVLLVHVSGIPPLEAHMRKSRGAAFDAYRARVNAFFPGPPHKEPRP